MATGAAECNAELCGSGELTDEALLRPYGSATGVSLTFDRTQPLLYLKDPTPAVVYCDGRGGGTGSDDLCLRSKVGLVLDDAVFLDLVQ